MDAQQVSTVPNQPRLSGGAIWTQDQNPARISASPVNASAITMLYLDRDNKIFKEELKAHIHISLYESNTLQE